MFGSCDIDISLQSFTEKIEKDSNAYDVAWTQIEEILKSSLLPEQSDGDDRPPAESDFVEFRKYVDSNLKLISEMLLAVLKAKNSFESQLAKSYESFDIKRDVVVWTLVLCGEHSSSDFWTTTKSLELAAVSVKTLCEICCCNTLPQLLTESSTTSHRRCFKQALMLLRPKLLRETWRRYPGAVSCYKWMLAHVLSPHLSEYLSMVLPTAFIIIDDYVTQRRLIGLSCMDHIIGNVARTELCQQGFQNVIFKALERMLFEQHADLVEPTVSCVTNLLRKTERGYTRGVEPGMWDKFDDTLQILLQKMAFEDRLVLRRAYIRSLGPLISAMGPSIIRWSKLLLSVLDDYTHKVSFDTQEHALQVLRLYLQLATPRLVYNGDSICFSLLRALCDVSLNFQKNHETFNHQLKIIEDCFRILIAAAPEQMMGLKVDICNMKCNLIMKEVLSKVFD